MGDDPDDRLSRTNLAVAAKASRARADLLLRDQKRATKRQAALKNDKFYPTIVSLESFWHSVTQGRFARWGKSEYGIIGDLLKRFDPSEAQEAVAAALLFAVRHEAALIPHLVGPKKQVSLSLSFLHRNAETWLMLAKNWQKHRTTWDKVEAWRAKHPSEYATMPYDLEQENDLARQVFSAATGFKL